MKLNIHGSKTLFTAAFCLLTLGLFAQKNQGTIQYKETIKLDINFEGMTGLTEEMKKMIPQEQSFENTLYFNKTASLYSNAKNESEDEDIDYSSEDGGMQLKIEMDSPERSYYKDLKSKACVESQDLFGKKFLISGDVKKMKWKMSSESKEILGYACKKATATSKDGKEIVAWFTSDIPVAVGPGSFNDLPGATLEVISMEGKHIVTATKVDLGKVDSKKIVQPKKGKKVSSEEFEKIAEEKAKEMAEMYGGSSDGGTQIIMKTERIEK